MLLCWSPSGYAVIAAAATNDVSRPHETALIVHPRYPKGAAHFLHPSPHLREAVVINVPGVPFDMVVAQRQFAASRETGFSVWRAATVLSRYLVADLGPPKKRTKCVELGCGSGAIVSSVASYLGFEAHATDRPPLLVDAQTSCRAHRLAAARTDPMKGPPVEVGPLDWSRRAAADFNRARGGPFDLVLGSEIVYATRDQSLETVVATFAKLSATIKTLLAPNGAAVLAWCPRSHVEPLFFDNLATFHLKASAPRPIGHLGLSDLQAQGIRIIHVSHTTT
ncbi:hypothetical protein CTAYLR_001130 [Chrysophaeum taylorii]|uniref:Methyltransferase domain-containing protein n=1 Tax=Chrysophaeum taylorii TaxID=2483200 RepID=A0AAD7XQN3_9STRA|nr:hypothetical protein CTAYLR_001130 [Chrysophaeum taylorii]